MGLVFSNFGKATIASAPSGTGGLSFSVTAGQGALFPTLGATDYFYGIFKDASGNREIVKIEARSTDSMTIAARGVDGTTARTWAVGDYFVCALTNIALQELFNANLSVLGGLTFAADTIPYFTGVSSASTTGLSAFIRGLLDDPDAAAARATLGITTSPDVIPAGTAMLFFQASAPVGWTQITTHNNKALRIVSGTGAGSGGSLTFTTAFASQAVSGTVGNTTLTIAQMPVHQHGLATGTSDTSGSPYAADGAAPLSGSLATTNVEGGGTSHTHSFTGSAINMAVQYIDMILASKD